tara:strand:- start:11405 stop:13273 length:1869 start_codon:yes stop_codon:yes gene_type:complete
MFNNLVIDKEERSMEQICKPSAFAYQKHQQFIKRWFKNGNTKLLLFHGIGSGKTCSSILAMQALMDTSIKRIFVATPASLQSNYENELKSECGKMKTIPKKISVLSHQKFIKAIHENPKILDNSIVIIDEIQNIVSSVGTSYRVLLNSLVCRNPKGIKVVLLSGTPMFDKPYEIAMTMNLLDIPEPLVGPSNKFVKQYISGGQLINQDDFAEKINGYVSAFKGVGPSAYARRKNKKLTLPMSEFQDIAYVNSNDRNGKKAAFYLNERQAINCVYPPNGSSGTNAKENVSKKALLAAYSGASLKKYSIKFHTCIQHLKSSECVGPIFAYSNLVNAGGINDFAIALEANGFNEFDHRMPIKSKKNTFAVFKSGQKQTNDVIIKTFNSPDNKDGSIIKAILGSPSMKEGVSLKATREVHLFEPYWNKSRTAQVIGRAFRFCSHIGIPDSQRNVDVYQYVGTSAKVKKTADEKIFAMAQRKQTVINKFEALLYRTSVDCKLFYNANGIERSECTSVVKNSRNLQKNKKHSCQAFPCKLKRNALGGCAMPNKEDEIRKALMVHGIDLDRKKGKLPRKQPIQINIGLKQGNKPFFFKKYPELNNLVKVKYLKGKKEDNANMNIAIKRI